MNLVELALHCDKINSKCEYCKYEKQCRNYSDENLSFKCVDMKTFISKLRTDIPEYKEESK